MINSTLPAKPDVERLVLGVILGRGDRFEAIRQAIDESVFTSEKHKQLWRAFEKLHAEGRRIDRVVIYHAANEIAPGLWTLGALNELDDDAPDVPALDSYLAMISDIATRRKAILELSRLANTLAEGSDTPGALQAAQRVADELGGALTASNGLQDVSSIVDAEGGLENFLRPWERGPAIHTPWPAVNEVFAGFEPGRMTVLAARPGDGKSTAALQILAHAAELGHSTALFSLEMAGPELLRRIGCICADVNLQKHLRGYCTQSENLAIGRALGNLASRRIQIDDSNAATIPAIRRALMRAKVAPELVIVDYLQLLSGAGSNSRRYEELGSITRALKILARELDVSVLALSQLTRTSEHERREPQLRDLRESGSIEQDADSVLMLHHIEDAERRGHDHAVKVLVRKQRSGPVGVATVAWRTRTASFADTHELLHG